MSVLAVYTVYCNARDFPGEYVVRRARLLDGAVIPDAQLWARGATLDDVRAQIPLGVVLFPRQAADDPAIVECWL